MLLDIMMPWRKKVLAPVHLAWLAGWLDQNRLILPTYFWLTASCVTYARLGVERRNDTEECEEQCEENQDGRMAPGAEGDRHCLL